MKKYFLLLQIIFSVVFANAQQRPHYSQYMLNNFLLNPAVGGTSDNFDIRSGYRSQWTGFEDAPKTFYLSGHIHAGKHIGPYAGRSRHESKSHHGFGFLIFKDVTGPLSRTSAYGSYSYVMKLSKTWSISAGAFLGFQQLRLDGSKLVLKDPSAPVAAGLTKSTPDGSLGLWLFGKKFYSGISVHQIFQNKIFFNDNSALGEGYKFSNHYFATAGYKIVVDRDLYILPSVLIKYVDPAPLSVDINTKVRWKEMIWAGVSYRHQESVVFVTGFSLAKTLEFGYSFDLGTSKNIRNFGNGTHEITLGIKPNPKGKVRSPSDFW